VWQQWAFLCHRSICDAVAYSDSPVCMYVCVCVCLFVCLFVCLIVCLCVCVLYRLYSELKIIDKYRIPEESPTQQNWKCCRLGLIEPVHGRHRKAQATAHAPQHRPKQNSTFKHEIFLWKTTSPISTNLAGLILGWRASKFVQRISFHAEIWLPWQPKGIIRIN
jgi:hypothetical protein